MDVLKKPNVMYAAKLAKYSGDCGIICSSKSPENVLFIGLRAVILLI